MIIYILGFGFSQRSPFDVYCSRSPSPSRRRRHVPGFPAAPPFSSSNDHCLVSLHLQRPHRPHLRPSSFLPSSFVARIMTPSFAFSFAGEPSRQATLAGERARRRGDDHPRRGAAFMGQEAGELGCASVGRRGAEDDVGPGS
ncbi:hypothetical protein Drorol1_Dr00013418 [Drosera rotundifolia]